MTLNDLEWLAKFIVHKLAVPVLPTPNKSSAVFVKVLQNSTVTSAEACSVSKQLASTSYRRQLLGKLLVQRWRGSSGNVCLSHLGLLISFLSCFISPIEELSIDKSVRRFAALMRCSLWFRPEALSACFTCDDTVEVYNSFSVSYHLTVCTSMLTPQFCRVNGYLPDHIWRGLEPNCHS